MLMNISPLQGYISSSSSQLYGSWINEMIISPFQGSHVEVFDIENRHVSPEGAAFFMNGDTRQYSPRLGS